jgi:hypothetical protein
MKLLSSCDNEGVHNSDANLKTFVVKAELHSGAVFFFKKKTKTKTAALIKS